MGVVTAPKDKWGFVCVGWVWLLVGVVSAGKDKWGFGFGGTGKKSYASQFDDYGEVSGKYCNF